MKILSVSDLQRTTDSVKEQQLNQTCFGNFLAPKCSRRPGRADRELPTTLLHPGKGLLEVWVSRAGSGQSQVVHRGKGHVSQSPEVLGWQRLGPRKRPSHFCYIIQ